MRKITALLTAVILAAMMLLGAVPALASNTVNTELIVSFDKNSFFSKYDVAVYLDGDYVDTVVQGYRTTLHMNGIDAGKHQFMFYSTQTRSVYGELSFTAFRNVSIECSIHAYNNRVEVSDAQMFGILSPLDEAAGYGGSGTFSYDISFEPNAYFSKYDVELYIDDEYIDTFVQGRETSGEVTLGNGYHTFTFYKVGGHSVSGSIRLSTFGDNDFRCRLNAFNDHVAISRIVTTASR